MPIPKPQQGESRDDFMGRCMVDSTMVDEYDDPKQRAGVCGSAYGKGVTPGGLNVLLPLPKPGESDSDFLGRCMVDTNMMDQHPDTDERRAACRALSSRRSTDAATNDRLLDAIARRSTKQAEFGYGIITADKYVRTIQECIGLDACYKFASAKNMSFNDVLTKAARTLVYSNAEMRLDGNGIEYAKSDGATLKKYDGVELPKNTLMVFRHVLTSPRKDRDGDILRSQGAMPDPNMLLLWQHVHTLPIGKLLSIAEHNAKMLRVVSCLVDMNELCHDAAVMLDNGMGRFSHGFRALEFTEMKAEEGETTSPGGFDVKRFEIMEESLVSVPSNVDAATEEILLSLVEGGKLTSGVMKSVGAGIRERRAIRVPVTVDLRLQLNGKDIGNEHTHNNGNAGTAGGTTTAGTGTKCGCGASAKANGGDGKADDAQNAEMTCPKCGGKIVDNKCTKCGYIAPDKSAKAGRVLSKNNEGKIREASALVKEVHGHNECPRACKSMCKEAMGHLDDVLANLGEEPDSDVEKTMSAETAFRIVLSKSTPAQLSRFGEAIGALHTVRETAARVNEYRALVG